MGLGSHRSFYLEILGVCPKVIVAPVFLLTSLTLQTYPGGAEQLDGCLLPGVERNEWRGASSGADGTNLRTLGRLEAMVFLSDSPHSHLL